MENFPNLEVPISELIAVIGQLALLAVLIVGFNNKVKELIPENLHKYFFIFSTLTGTGLVVAISRIRPDIFMLGIREAIFFGFFVGLSASGLYDAGLGKIKDTDSNDKKKDSIGVDPQPTGRLEKDAILDAPRSTDWQYDMVFGGQQELPHKILLGNDVDIQSQRIKRTPSTAMACGSYGIGQATNVANDLEDSNQYILCHQLWRDFVDEYKELYKKRYNMNPLTDGSYLQHQLDFARDGLIAGYAKVSTKQHMKQALSNGQLIYTGTSNIDRGATINNNNEAVIGSGYSHAFCIDGYNGGWFRCRNSGGKDYMDNGRFRLHEDDIDVLFTKYVIFDKEDQIIVDTFVSIIKKAKERLRKGNQPDSDVEQIAYQNMVRKGEI